LSESSFFIDEIDEHKKKDVHPSSKYYDKKKIKEAYRGKYKKGERLNLYKYQQAVRRARLISDGLDDVEADLVKSMKFSSKLSKKIRSVKKKILKDMFDGLIRGGRRRSKKVFQEARELAIQYSKDNGLYIRSGSDLSKWIEILSPVLGGKSE
jgi:hypothetical protein